MRRIDEWVERTLNGFAPEDFALDAHLSFGKTRVGAIATIDLDSLTLDGKRGKIGTISAAWKKDDPVLEIVRGNTAAIEGRWYYVGSVRVPPRNLEGVRALLGENQKNNFDRRFKAVAKHGKPMLFLIAWDRELGREALVLLAEKDGEEVIARAVEVAPTDAAILKLRCGPDAEALAEKRVAIFGVGAVGSNTALRLAEVGVGHLRLIDNARLRPGDIVRHAAGSWQVGDTKVQAVRFLIHTRAPWTAVAAVEESTWDPDAIAVLLEQVNLVVDATGFASFANLLSVMCAERLLPLVTAALFRGGAVARIRRQALTADTPISDRASDRRYPLIPPGDEPPVFEPGCSAAVNNASPVAVAVIAATAADVAVDHLTGRNLYPDEIIDVYRPLEDAPFDTLGRVGT
jgi:molybdopterin/thiamine biosynthesis adenylyltransferase